MKTLTSLAAAIWFALLGGLLMLLFWLDSWLARDKEEA